MFFLGFQELQNIEIVHQGNPQQQAEYETPIRNSTAKQEDVIPFHDFVLESDLVGQVIDMDSVQIIEVTPDKIKEFLNYPITPQRKNIMNVKKAPFVLTSKERIKLETEKLEEKHRKISELEERKKLRQKKREEKENMKNLNKKKRKTLNSGNKSKNPKLQISNRGKSSIGINSFSSCGSNTLRLRQPETIKRNLFDKSETNNEESELNSKVHGKMCYRCTFSMTSTGPNAGILCTNCKCPRAFHVRCTIGALGEHFVCERCQ